MSNMRLWFLFSYYLVLVIFLIGSSIKEFMQFRSLGR